MTYDWTLGDLLTSGYYVIGAGLTMLSLLYFLLISIPVPFILAISGTLLLTLFVYVKSMVNPIEDIPKLTYLDSSLAKHVISRCPRLRASFRPPRWATNGHVQTLLSLVLPANRDFHFERQYIQMKDRGIISLDWGVTGVARLKKNAPILLAVTSLNGTAVDLAFLCTQAIRRGFRPVVFNKRGQSGSPLTTPRLQAYGDPTDLRQAVRYIRDTYSGCKLLGYCTSTGCGLLLSYLGEYGSSSYITAAVCVSPSYDTQTLITKPIAWPYNLINLYRAKSMLANHVPSLSKIINIPAAMQTNTMAEFELEVYCKLTGSTNLHEYLNANDPMRDADDICTPLLCINSLDDPICKQDTIDYDLFSISPNLMLVTTQFGGHASFVECHKYEPWSDKLAVEYLKAVLEFMERNPSQY